MEKKQFLNNTLASLIDNLISFAVPFVLFPFIIRHLGVEISGVWFLCSTITGYFGILEQGPGPAIVKYISEFYAKKEIKAVNHYVSSAFILFVVFGFIVMTTMFLFGYYGPAFLKLGSISINTFRNVFFMMGVTLAIVFPLKVFASIIRGLQEFKIHATVNIAMVILKAGLTIYFLRKGFGIFALLIINFLQTFITCGAYFVILKIKYPVIKIDVMALEKKYFKSIFAFGGVTFLINLCAVLMFQTDRVILGAFLSVGAITYYAACKQIYDVCRFFPVLILQAIMPFASELQVSGKDVLTKKLLFLSTKYSYFLFIPMGVFVIFMASDILGIWVGKEYVPYSVCLQVLVFHLFFNFLHQAGTQVLIGHNKIRFILGYYIAALVLNIFLSLVLVRKYQLIGLALGTTIPFVLLEWMFLVKMTNLLKINLIQFLKAVLLKNVNVLVIAMLTTWLMKIYFRPYNLFALVLLASICFLFSLVAFLISGMEKEERSMFLNYLKPGSLHA